MSNRGYGWGLGAALVAIEAAITALMCWIAVPDFASIEQYRIDVPGKSTIIHSVAGAPAGADLLYLPTYGGSVAVAVDGVPVALVMHDEDQLTRSRHFATATIPVGHSDQAQLGIVQNDNFQKVPLSPVYLAPAAAIAPVVAQHRAYGWLMQQLIPIAGMITVALSTLLIFFSRRPLKYFFLIVAFALQTLIELNPHFVSLGVSMVDLGQHLGTLVNIAIACSVAIWTGAGQGHRRFILWSGVAMLAVLSVGLFGGRDVNQLTAVPVKAIYGVWLIAISINSWAMILRAQFRSSLLQMGTLAAIALAFSGLMSFTVLSNGRFSIGTTFFITNWVNVATALGVLMFILGALANEIALYRNQRRNLQMLEGVVAGHHFDQEHQARDLQRQIEQTAVLQERERFVRDMHDGIGGQLLTLLLKVRSTEKAPTELGSDVQAIIGELRLITSALDQTEDDLGEALVRLRQQLEVQTQAANLELGWAAPEQLSYPLDPRAILDLTRAIQEAVSNAVRHARARRIEVGIVRAQGLTIVVSDDGTGFDPATVRPGKGLRNIRDRIERIGGVVDFGPGAEGKGTRVTVLLPSSANRS